MTPCNYIPLNTDYLDPESVHFDDIFDLDILCTDEGIFLNTALPAKKQK